MFISYTLNSHLSQEASRRQDLSDPDADSLESGFLEL